MATLPGVRTAFDIMTASQEALHAAVDGNVSEATIFALVNGVCMQPLVL
jgi:hypothetical protein